MIDGLVSVVIPTFNRRALIKDALASLAAQSWGAVEVIVIDDGSDDGTGDMIAELVDSGFRWPITYRRQANTGPGAARNHGRRLARGTYLYHLDSDDILAPDGLSDLIAAMQAGGAPFAVGGVANTDLAGRRDRLEPVQRPLVLPGDIVGSRWYTHAALYRRDLVDAVGGYDPALPLGEDTELHWRILAQAGLPAVSDAIVAARRIHGFGQLSAANASIQRMRSTLALFEHMQATHARLFETNRNRARVVLLAVAFGVEADWEHRDRAVMLLSRMLGPSPRAWRLVGPLLGPRSVGYFRVLRLGATLARRLLQPLLKRRARGMGKGERK